jgi:acyl-CoA synthetase (AMP-forming)/AMP-acid ligase II
MQTLANIARPHAQARGSKIALRFGEEALTYAELESRACRTANALIAAGIGVGDRVAYLGRNSIAYFELLLGAAKARAVTVPLNWRLAIPELRRLLEDAAPRLLFATHEFAEAAAQTAGGTRRIVVGGAPDAFGAWRDAHTDIDPGLSPEPTDGTLQLYTSGTTGSAKGAVLTHRSLFGLRETVPLELQPEWYRWSHEDVSLIAMPASHISGSGWGIWTLQHGATGIVTPAFDPHAVFDLMVAHRINRLMLVPTAIRIALSHPAARRTRFAHLRHISYGGSPMPPELLREAMEVFGCGFVHMYGMTETAGTIVALPPEDHDPAGGDRMRSVGVPLPGVELKIVDSEGRTLPTGEVGEVLTRSVANMAGYHHRPEQTAETIDADGWLHTGDAGYVDREGYLYLRDRIKDLIISGAENIYPGEIEDALRSHPEIAEVAVIGAPDEKWGEAVVAFVVPKPDHAPAAADIIAWARSRIAGYKVPKRIEFIRELPRNATGKVLRRQLRELYRG